MSHRLREDLLLFVCVCVWMSRVPVATEVGKVHQSLGTWPGLEINYDYSMAEAAVLGPRDACKAAFFLLNGFRRGAGLHQLSFTDLDS